MKQLRVHTHIEGNIIVFVTVSLHHKCQWQRYQGIAITILADANYDLSPVPLSYSGNSSTLFSRFFSSPGHHPYYDPGSAAIFFFFLFL